MGEKGIEGAQTTISLHLLSDSESRPVPEMNSTTVPKKDPEMAK
ncbi:hypothetical protein VULLAG_LOCUS10021 [Vulpes lagopus]